MVRLTSRATMAGLVTISRNSMKLNALACAVRIVPITAAVSAALSGTASAATIPVTDSSALPTANSCSIVDAVDSINNATLMANCHSVGMIAFGTDDTIDLTGFKTPTNIAFSNCILSVALNLTVPATISGDVTPNGSPLVTISRSPQGGSCTLLVTNRDLTVNGVAFSGGYSGFGGGAISEGNTAATLSISHSLISGNYASDGGGIASVGPVTITDTVVTGNSAQVDGGGIWVYEGAPVFLSGAVISDNRLNPTFAGVYGGAGIWSNGNVIAVGTLISGNSAPGYGGGILTTQHVQLTASTVSANSAGTGQGGGVYAGSVATDKSTISDNFAGYTGGGVVANQVAMLNSTVSGNTAGTGGGGGLYAGSSVSLAFTTVASNVSNTYGVGLLIGPAGQASMTGALLHGNHYVGVSQTNDLGAVGNVTVAVGGSYNLVGSYSKPVTVPIDTLSCNPGLLPLADNGGPTQTMAPNVACVIDMGPASTALASTDQRGRGYPRKSGSATDIGAYEVQPADRIFYDGFDD